MFIIPSPKSFDLSMRLCIHPSRLRVVVLYALLFQRNKYIDLKSCTILILIYCSSEPYIRCVSNSFFLGGGGVRGKTSGQKIRDIKAVRSKSCVRFSSKGIKLWISNPVLIYSWYIVVLHLVLSVYGNLIPSSNFRSKLLSFSWCKRLSHKSLLCVSPKG